MYFRNSKEQKHWTTVHMRIEFGARYYRLYCKRRYFEDSRNMYWVCYVSTRVITTKRDFSSKHSINIQE